ncbi:pilus assembly FimT family protein [Echinimonas agarilytica]|uniref:Type II secretion system GspH family protein n=1 Tax=Echinimonas agarilytica TaxID=1215918 RepID=A0AA41W8K3_9GAMM|nr:type II secretion system protein [Echinimonas agarilytica]MCM2680493.1 type II secretion system GspH family protein [Echinimonas agarilytica]
MRERGFTLIELTAVLVMVAIVSSFAVPRFTDTHKSAVESNLEAMRGALSSAVDLVHMKAQIEGKISGSDSVDVGGTTISIFDGYPIAHWNRSVRYLVSLDDESFSRVNSECDSDWCGRGNQLSLPGQLSISIMGRAAKVWLNGYEWADSCSVYYVNNLDGSPPLIDVVTDGC